MGIIKIRQQKPENDDHVQGCPHNCTLDEIMQEESLLSVSGHGNNFDDSELTDAGCEYALLDEQIVGVPYEIFYLQDLKEILSLNNWNSYLTAEERLHLAAYLPDMDCETFGVTIMELFSGGNLFFGSPLKTLLSRLKAGFYTPQVTHLREGSKFLQKRGYYHSLRTYHESMAQKFVEMRKAWSNCQPGSTVEERIQIWNKKYQKPVFLVDLNAIPADEELPRKREKKHRRIPPLKKKKMVDEEVSTRVGLMDSNGTALSSGTIAKGVLKIKPIEMNSTPKQVVLSLPMESSEPFRRPPKGVLKVKPKGYPISEVERPRVIQAHPDHTSGSVFHALTTRLSPSHFSPPWPEENISNKLPYLHQSVKDESVMREDILNVNSGLYNNRQSAMGKMKTVKGMRMNSDDSSDFAETSDRRQTAALCSSGLYESTSEHYHVNVSEPLLRNSITVIDTHQMYRKYPDNSEHRFVDENSGDGVDRSLIFPLTYKRKKPYTKFNAFQANLGPVEGTGAHFPPMEKAKSIKIRVKGWNDSQYKQGMLNGLHHGSPST